MLIVKVFAGRGQPMEYLRTPELKGEEAAILEGSEDRYSKLQLYFLRRLNYLLRSRQQQRAHGTDAVTLRLLDRAIFATYRDCAAAGVTADAQKVIQTTIASPSSTERTRKN
jgi:hypothetical protein